MRVRNIIVHENWSTISETNYGSDIATLIVTSQFTGKTIKYISLPTEGEMKKVNQIVYGTIVGWGSEETSTTFDYNLTPPRMNMATIKIVEWLTCYKNDPKIGNMSSELSFCGFGVNGSGPCMGDSGSPLVIKLGTKWLLRGIISAGLILNGECVVKSGAVYTDISKFTGWIQDIAKDNGLSLYQNETEFAQQSALFLIFMCLVLLSCWLCWLLDLRALMMDGCKRSIKWILKINRAMLIETAKNFLNGPNSPDMCPEPKIWFTENSKIHS